MMRGIETEIGHKPMSQVLKVSMSYMSEKIMEWLQEGRVDGNFV